MAPIATLTVRLSAQMAEFQQQFQAATRTTQQFQNNFQQTATRAAAIGSLIGNTLAGHVNRLGGELLNLVAQGQKLSSVERSFERLSASVRQNSDAMRGALREGTQGLVSDLDLLQSANKAILLGLPVTTQEMGDLAKTATALGRAMGLDATQSLDDLITALGRSSPLILDNLGLTVKVGEANEAYARSIGKTVDQLTEAEKKMAFYRAAMEAARVKVKELGDQTLTLGDIAQKAWISIGNIVTSVSSDMNVAIGRILTRKNELKAFLADLVSSGSLGASVAFAGLRSETPQRGADIVLPDPNRKTQEQLDGLKKKTDEARKSTDAYRESVRALADQLSGSKLQSDVRRLEDAWRSLTETQRASLPVIERTADAAQKLADEGANLTPELFQLTLQTGAFYRSLLPVESGMKGLENEFVDIAPAIKASADELIDFLAVLNDPKLRGIEGLRGLTLPGEQVGPPQIPAPPPNVLSGWEILADTISDISRQLPGLAGDFAQFGAAAFRAFAQVASGAMTAAQAVQSLQGGAYGLLFSLVANGFRQTFMQPEISREQMDAFFSQFGGRSGFNLAALQAGQSTMPFDRTIEFNSAASFELEARRISEAIRKQQETLDRYGLSWRDLNQEVRQATVAFNASGLYGDFVRLTKAGIAADKVIDSMSDSLNQLIIDAVRTGTQIPGALRPMLETLIRSRQISEEAARALLGIADDGMPALEDITAAAERYGLTLDQLGPKVQQLRINDEAKQIVADFKLLTDAGADATVVAGAMVGKIQNILDISWKTGAEVPIALKPIIQILIDMGLLTDANGNKLENIDDINFGKDLVSAIDLLIEKLDELLSTLLDIDEAAAGIDIPGARPNPGGGNNGPAIPRPGGGTTPQPQPPPEGGTPTPTPPPGSRPQDVSFSEGTADQGVTTFSTAGVTGGSENGLTATFVLNLDGREVAAATVPYIPGEVQRFGLA